VSLTSNFDFCVQLSIAAVREIFHLAFKNEDLFPHNVGPFDRAFSGRVMRISAHLLDDMDAPADLSFQDEKHIRFSLPFELRVEAPDAPDPALSSITLRSRVELPGALASWPVDGQDQLGVDFSGVTVADVAVGAIDGLPELTAERFAAAIHSRYGSLQHVFSLSGNTLVIYDGTRDPVLSPPNNATPQEIQAAIENHGGTDYLKVTVPIHVTITTIVNYTSYGRIIFWRAIQTGDGSVSIDMGAEPADAALKNKVELDSGPDPVRNAVIAQLTPMVQGPLAAFGVITEPWFTAATAADLLKREIVAYAVERKFPIYTPDSGDPEMPLSTPVGFLLPADGVLAILMNRRDGSVADHAPDNFLGSRDLALAVGRAKVDEIIAAAIEAEFPNLDDGGHRVETPEGSATLKSLSVTPSDAGAHDVGEGHLWVAGEAEVHIDCWPDPDVSFDGPIFLRVLVHETDETCSIEIQPEVGDFDFDQSCCDVFIDLLIPIVGWVMLAVIESTIDEVGGELADEIGSGQGRAIDAIPPYVKTVAELQACIEGLEVRSEGFVFPGKLRIRREGRSYEDLKASGDRPRP
jgi:hypothetical protein